MTATRVLDTLRRHGLHLTRSLGQNFLVDDNILGKIVAAADLTSGDTILEVGAGIGVLTEALAASGAQVLAVELDQRMAAVLGDVAVQWPNVTVLTKDAMKLTADELARPLAVDKLVANLPYNIAAPLLLHLADIAPTLGSCVVMVQKEIAQRICATSGGKIYGAYTLKLQYYFECRTLFAVGRNAFIPRPKVDSAVVGLIRHPGPPVSAPKDRLFSIINTTFSQRRKMVATTVAEELAGRLTKPQVAALISAAGIDPKSRPEELSLDDFDALARRLVADSAG